MKFLKTVELRNLLIDLIITLLALNYLDISHFVERSLPFVIYFIIPLQSIGFFLMYADRGLENIEEGRNFFEKTKSFFAVCARASAMFYWVLGLIWIYQPLEYLRQTTGVYYSLAATVSLISGVALGILILVRMFANMGDEEKLLIAEKKALPNDRKRAGERIILPVYETLLYKNFGTENFRSRLGWFLVFAFLIYTETLYEIMFASGGIKKSYLIASIVFSYFPVRIVLLTRPPYSFIELVSALISFLIFIYALIFY